MVAVPAPPPQESTQATRPESPPAAPRRPGAPFLSGCCCAWLVPLLGLLLFALLLSCSFFCSWLARLVLFDFFLGSRLRSTFPIRSVSGLRCLLFVAFSFLFFWLFSLSAPYAADLDLSSLLPFPWSRSGGCRAAPRIRARFLGGLLGMDCRFPACLESAPSRRPARLESFLRSGSLCPFRRAAV